MTTYRMDPEPDVDTVWGVTRGGVRVTLTRNKRSPLGIRWFAPSGDHYSWPEVLTRGFERVTDVNPDPDPLADYPLPWRTYNDGRIAAANGRVVADVAATTYDTAAPLAALIIAAVNAYGAQLPAREATA